MMYWKGMAMGTLGHHRSCHRVVERHHAADQREGARDNQYPSDRGYGRGFVCS